jgi:hypothetical protein
MIGFATFWTGSHTFWVGVGRPKPVCNWSQKCNPCHNVCGPAQNMWSGLQHLRFKATNQFKCVNVNLFKAPNRSAMQLPNCGPVQKSGPAHNQNDPAIAIIINYNRFKTPNRFTWVNVNRFKAPNRSTMQLLNCEPVQTSGPAHAHVHVQLIMCNHPAIVIIINYNNCNKL